MAAPAPYRAGATATATIPLYLRFTLTTLEPIFALGGFFITLARPAQYLQTLTGAHPSLRSSSSFSSPSWLSAIVPAAATATAIPYDPRTHFLYTELAGAWLMFAFNEAVVLRLVDDVFVWTLLCWGMLLSDACYMWSTAEAMGGWAQFLAVGEWRVDDWVVFLTTIWPFMARVLVVLRVGFNSAGRKLAEGGRKKM